MMTTEDTEAEVAALFEAAETFGATEAADVAWLVDGLKIQTTPERERIIVSFRRQIYQRCNPRGVANRQKAMRGASHMRTNGKDKKRFVFSPDKKRFAAIKLRLRSEGYHPAPRKGANIWLHRDDCTMAIIEWDRELSRWSVEYAVDLKALGL